MCFHNVVIILIIPATLNSSHAMTFTASSQPRIIVLMDILKLRQGLLRKFIVKNFDKISASAEGGPRSLVCARETPYRH